jgi:hypothetical protein
MFSSLGIPSALVPPVFQYGSGAASEVFSDDQRYILVDTASRPGMSGSPVIRRSWGTNILRNGGTSMGIGAATKLVGVYSGRLATSEPSDPQLGITWPVHFIQEIVSVKVRDTY